MVDKIENKNSKNYVELSESQIFEKIKEDLNPIQENLAEKEITVDEAKSELKKINEWLQGTKLENKDKKEIGKAFEKLMKLEKNIDENTLKNEVEEIKNLLETLTRKDLDNLSANVLWQERKPEVQKGIDESNKNFRNHFAYAAKHEPNTVAKIAAIAINNILKDDLA